MSALAPRRALVEEAIRTGGARGAVADTILRIESPGFASWQPKTGDLARLKVPAVLMVTSETLAVYKQVIEWLAGQLKVEPVTVPGRHGFYYYRPQDLADVLRPILRRFTTT